MVLQQLVEVGHLEVSDCLLDDNNVVMKVTMKTIFHKSRTRKMKSFR